MTCMFASLSMYVRVPSCVCVCVNECVNQDLKNEIITSKFIFLMDKFIKNTHSGSSNSDISIHIGLEHSYLNMVIVNWTYLIQPL